jgi:hypothetical protein
MRPARRGTDKVHPKSVGPVIRWGDQDRPCAGPGAAGPALRILKPARGDSPALVLQPK